MSGDPTAVEELLVNQGTEALDDFDLTLNVADGNEFLQRTDIGLGFHPLPELKREPFPIGCEVPAHQQHDSHDPRGKLAETD